MMKLIEKYSAPTSPVRMVHVSRPEVTLKGGSGKLEFAVTNRTKRALSLNAAIEAPQSMKATLQSDAKLSLQPGESAKLLASVELVGEQKPGFYHVFLRLEASDVIAYGWGMAMHQGPPIFGEPQIEQVKYGSSALEFQFDQSLTVVYAQDATSKELEAAWVLFSTLEAATGRPLDIYHLPSLPMERVVKSPLILVGRPDHHQLMGLIREQVKQQAADAKSFVVHVPAEGTSPAVLVVGGETDDDVAAAAMDLVLRFWPNAKDSGASRVPLIERKLAPGRHDTDLDK